MAATSYSTLPSSTYTEFGSKQDPYHSTIYSTYDGGFGSLTSHPYQYETNSYGTVPVDNQQTKMNSYSNSQVPITDYRPIDTNNNNTGSNGMASTTQTSYKKNINNQQVESKNHQQNSYADTTQQRPPVSIDNQYQRSQTQLIRSEHQVSNRLPKEQQRQQQHKSQPPLQSNLTRSEQQMPKSRASPPIPHHLPSNGDNNYASETSLKTTSLLQELKPTKSSQMRAAAIQKKEKTLEQKRQDRYFPSSENKTTLTKLKPQHESPKIDLQQTKKEKPTRNKKQSHSLPKQRQSRRDGNQTEDNKSSADDNTNTHHRSKSQKRATFSDTHLDKHSHLPPLRHGRMPPYHDPYMDYPLPPGHPLRGRYPHHEGFPPYDPYYGPYGHHHLYGGADDIPPYLPPYHDAYDPFFDYEKRKVKPKRHTEKTEAHGDHEENNGGTTGYETEGDDGAKSRLSRKSRNKNKHNDHGGRKSRRDEEENMHPPWPPGYYPPQYYNGRDMMLEYWRQERNDYLKRKFKPSIHDVLYSQQWMKADSYLENQRRRVVRDAQGYYFPYKKYTLKDYRDLQKLNNPNPFGDTNEAVIDRKERAKKRQEYGSLVERQMVDNPGTRHIPPREMDAREPWHLSNSDHDPEKSSRRERALEYAKVQVRHQPTDSTGDQSYRSDPNERSMNNHMPNNNDDRDRSNYERTRNTNQLYDDYD